MSWLSVGRVRAALVPAFALVDDPNDQQHHWHLDQYPDHGGQRRAGLEAEQADGGRYG